MHAGTAVDARDFITLIRPIHLSEVVCSGNETSVFECSHSTSGTETCLNGPAAVVCQGTCMLLQVPYHLTKLPNYSLACKGCYRYRCYYCYCCCCRCCACLCLEGVYLS